MTRPVVYFGHHGSTELLIAVHKALAADGSAAPTPAFILFNGYWRRHVTRAFPEAKIAMLPNRLEWRRARAAAPAADTSDPEFQRGWRLDKVLRFKPADEVRPLWNLTRARMSAFLDEVKPALLVSELVQSMACYAIYLECRKRGIPFVQLCGSRIPGGMEYYLGEECQPAFINEHATPSDASMALARRLVSEVKSRDYAGPGYMRIQQKKVYFRWSDVRKTIDYLAEQFQGGLLEPDVKPFWHPFVSKFAGKKKFSGDAYRDYCVGAEALDKVSGKKLLFPLHVTPEASTDLWTPAYADMAETARKIVANLPPDWTLVMKEHPSSLFIQRTDADIRALSAVPRSLVLAPGVSNDWLLTQVNATIVVTGTFGLEAVMKGKPVLTLGAPFYDRSGQTLPVPDPKELPDIVRRAETFRVDEDRLIHFVACYADAVDPGLPANSRLFPAVYNDANIRNIAAGLKKRFLAGAPAAARS